MDKLPTGSRILDKMLEGGYENDVLTTIYGPAGSGKTNLCLIASRNIAKKEKKILFVDSEGGFSVERLKQICVGNEEELKQVMENILFLKPVSFDEQESDIKKLKNLWSNSIKISYLGR